MILRGQDFIRQLGVDVFDHIKWLPGGFVQTLGGRFWPGPKDIEDLIFHKVELTDGSHLSVVETSKPLKEAPSVLLVHGLAGCHASSYMIRIAQRLAQNGFRVFRMSMRNCGLGAGWSPGMYHSGRCDDIADVLNWVHSQHPKSQLHLVGFSLGANISLNYLIHCKDRIPHQVSSATTIAPPSDMKSCAAKIQAQPFFDYVFSEELRKAYLEASAHHDHWPEYPRWLRLTRVDELITAPFNGFKDAADYYAQTTTVHRLSEIEIPTLILNSMDDPVIDGRTLLDAPDTPYVKYVITHRGGHLGYLDQSNHQRRWMDEVIEQWLKLNTKSS